MDSVQFTRASLEYNVHSWAPRTAPSTRIGRSMARGYEGETYDNNVDT